MTNLEKQLPLVQMLLDRMAIGTSFLCMVHCIALPVVLVFFPTILSVVPDEHQFHQKLVWFIIPFSVGAALLGCIRTKDKLVLTGTGLGIIIIVTASMSGHDWFGELGEKLSTVVGSLLLMVSHYRNFILCRRRSCTDCC